MCCDICSVCVCLHVCLGGVLCDPPVFLVHTFPVPGGVERDGGSGGHRSAGAVAPQYTGMDQQMDGWMGWMDRYTHTYIHNKHTFMIIPGTEKLIFRRRADLTQCVCMCACMRVCVHACVCAEALSSLG